MEATSGAYGQDGAGPGRVPLWERRVAGWLGRHVWLRNRGGGPWPVPDHLTYDAVSFEGNTGAALSGRYFHLDRATERGARTLDALGLADPRGVVVCVHPDRRYASHWFVKEGWVDWLTRHGFEVLVFDLPFYGRTDGKAHYYPEDVLAAVGFARRWGGDLPIYVVGVSMGAFAVANASPWLGGVEGAVLESPFSTFADWYDRGLGRVGSKLCEWLFPRSMRLWRADVNIRQATPRRILVAASRDDRVTDAALSRRVARLAPADRTEYVEFDGAAHLELFQNKRYRRAILETFGVVGDDADNLGIRNGTDEAFALATGTRSRRHESQRSVNRLIN